MNLNVGWQHYAEIAEGAPGGRSPSIARGYFKVAYHLWATLGGLPGIHVVDTGQKNVAHPKLSFHLCPPHFFEPVPDKVNVLMSMWEGDALPEKIVDQLAWADHCIVPSAYCQEVWRAHGIDAAVVPLGISEPYIQSDNTRPLLAGNREKLRFLWLGSNLERKGWPLLAPAWRMAFEGVADVELYIKTIGDGEPQSLFGGRVYIDTRDLDEAALVELYEGASVFIFPSYGEGFGLPALEAMAAGCLVIAPESYGLTEFVNPYTALVMAPGRRARVSYGAEYEMSVPEPQALAAAMRKAYEMWGTGPLETIRRTGAQYARRFTWKAAAERLLEVLRAIRERQTTKTEEEALVVH